jgi:Heat induced stress protein YflT domain
MANQNLVPGGPRRQMQLEFPQSLAVYDTYAEAQRTVDFLSDHEFPVENCLIVGTDLKQLERITGRLSYGKVAVGGLVSGLWLGLFVGLVLSLFSTDGTAWGTIIATAAFGGAFGVIWAIAGFAATRGQRDFSSVSTVVATRYEVLVEHKHTARARELLAGLPGALPNPFS